MAKARNSTNSVEDTLALVNTTLASFIDDFWASIAASHTPTTIELRVTFSIVSTDGATPRTMSPISFYWYEDAAVQNTRMKAILSDYLTGLAAAIAESSYDTVQSVTYNATLEITY